MSAIDLIAGPISEEWIISQTPATAADLAAALGSRDTEALVRWHDELAAAVNELYRDRIGTEASPTNPGAHRPWSVDDPVVALVRAVAAVARRQPAAASATARLLIELLGWSRPDQPASASASWRST